MRTSLFIASACCLLPHGARGDCTGYTYRTRLVSLEGCFGVYVSCWSKFGDSCDLEFDAPDDGGAGAGYAIVEGSTASMTTPYHGKIHCGSEDGSVQWKNYEEAMVCPVDTEAPTDAPTVSPTTSAPTDAPTTSPTAAVPLASSSVRAALNELCATHGDAEEECLSRVDELMASLIEEAAEEAAGEGGEGVDVDVVASVLGARAGGVSAATALPIVLASVAAILAVSLYSYLRPRQQQGVEYRPVPDASI